MAKRRIELDEEFDIPRTTAQQRRFGSQGNYAPPLLRRAQATWLALARRHAPEKPLAGPVGLYVSLYYHSRRAKDIAFKITRPDLDNAVKVIQDALVKAGWLRDDAQICVLNASKIVTYNKEHIAIVAEEIC